MAENDQDRTEQPTSRKRDEARLEGNVAVSREAATFFVILGALLVLYFTGVWMAERILAMMGKPFFSFRQELTPAGVIVVYKGMLKEFFTLLIPIFIIPLFGLASYLMQNGLLLSTKSLTPDFSKISPVSGVKRMFSVGSLAELGKSLLKISVLSYVVYVNVMKEWYQMPFLMDMEVISTFSYIATVSFKIMIKTVWVLALIAVLDFIYQRWQHERGLKMTREEVKEEMKHSEGDPNVKARIKSLQREMARKRMMKDVPEADVVVTNPTHLAVALKYDKAKADAPLVVAKGAGHVAERIRELARENGVPLVENKPLARALFKSVEIGSEIPEGLYKAVAELLAYVYKLKNKVVG